MGSLFLSLSFFFQFYTKNSKYVYLIEEPFSKIHTPKVEPTDTIEEIKREVEARYEIPTEDQQLICGVMILTDHHTLQDCGLEGNSLLRLQTDTSAELSIRFITGDPVTLSANIGGTMETVKNKVLFRLGLGPSIKIPFVFNGIQLKDSYKLSEYNVIHDNATIICPLYPQKT